MKKLLLVLISFCLAVFPCATGFAKATKEPRRYERAALEYKNSYTFYEDFSDDKLKQFPESLNMISNVGSTSAQVEKDNESGKNILRVIDNNSSQNISFGLPLKHKSNRLLIEIKFKYLKTVDDYMSFGFDVMNGNTLIGRVIVWSSGGTMNVSSDDGTNLPLSINNPVSGEWYELQILLDKSSSIFDVQLTSDALKNTSTKSAVRLDANVGVSMVKGTPFYSNAKEMSADLFKIYTNGKRGELIIDYIRYLDNAGILEFKGEKPKPIELPIIATPEITPPENQFNIKYNNTYMMFTDKPYFKDGELFIPVRNAATAFNMSLEYDNGNYILSGRDKKIIISGSEGTIKSSGSSYTNAAAVTGKTTYVKLSDFAKCFDDIIHIDEKEAVIGKE